MLRRSRPTPATPSEHRFDKHAVDWTYDRYMAARKSAQRAWAVAGGATLLATVSLIAVAALTPLKSVQPFVVRVDNSTGLVDVVSTVRTSSETYDEAVNRYFVAQFVRAREGYLRATANRDYELVAVMASQPVREAWVGFFAPSNPGSPLRTYGDHGEVQIEIKNISFLNPTTAYVRYRRTERLPGSVNATHHVATLTFRYSGEPVSQQIRELNPLGFQVLTYRTDPELVGGGGA